MPCYREAMRLGIREQDIFLERLDGAAVADEAFGFVTFIFYDADERDLNSFRT